MTWCRVLTEPRNALFRQYQRFFEMEGATLEVTKGALKEVAHEGARAEDRGARAAHHRRRAYA